MERLTNRIDVLTYPSHGVSFDKIVKKLCEYEDMEESGKLVRLPIKVGDEVYVITRNFISKYHLDSIAIYKNGINYNWSVIEGIYIHIQDFSADQIGKTVFLTRAEAESMLKNVADKAEGNA